jgi:small subunit ribosomal protein S8
MSLNDPLANALSLILNAEKASKSSCTISSSGVIKCVLNIMKKHGYIGEFKETDKSRGGIIEVKLIGNINKCGVIKPHFSVKIDQYEKYESRYLPAANFGIIIISTSSGLMTHPEAKKKGIGGKLVAYCY